MTLIELTNVSGFRSHRMSKRDLKRQRSRSRAAKVGAERAATRGATGATPKPRAKPVRTQTGLEWLASKNRLNRDQRKTGEDYGLWYRLSIMDGAESLKSCLDTTPGGNGDGVPKAPIDTAAWIADGRTKLSQARLAINYHPGMTAVCDLICGRGFMPREISTNQRETDEIETSLRLALDQIDKYFQDVKRSKR